MTKDEMLNLKIEAEQSIANTLNQFLNVARENGFVVDDITFKSTHRNEKNFINDIISVPTISCFIYLTEEEQ